MANTISTKELEKAKELLTDIGSQLSQVVKDLQDNMNNIVDTSGQLSNQWQKAVTDAEGLNNKAQKYVALESAASILREKINELKSKSLVLDALGLQAKINEIKIQNQLLQAQKTFIENKSKAGKVQKQLIAEIDREILKNEALAEAYSVVGGAQNETIDTLQKEYNKLIKKMETVNNEQSGFNILLSVTNKLLGFQIKEFFTFFHISNVLATIADAFTSVEDASFDVRKNLGLIRNEGDRVKTLIADSYLKFANLGVTASIVGGTINSIANGLGSSLLITQQMVDNFSIIETSLGIASEQSVKVARTFAGISKSSTMSQSSMIGFVKELSKAAGTSFAKIMEDLANLTESVRLTFRGTTVQLVKSTVEARRLGLSIADVGAAAEKLLDFQESINAEIEASVMLGKNISFNEARVLAYRGNILGATKQILDTIEKSADLNQLDYFTLKAIAVSTGLTVDKLQESLQLRKDLRLVESMGTEEARKQASLFKSLNNMSDSFAKSEGERAIENLKNTNNLALQKQLQTELNGLILQLGQAVLPVLKALGYILQIFTYINTGLRTIIGETGANWVSAIGLVSISVVAMKAKWGELFSMMLGKWPKIQSMLNFFTGATAAPGAAGAGKMFGKGAMFAGIGSFLKSLGAGVTLIAAAVSLQLLAQALKEFPTDLGGLSIGEFMKDMAGGILYLTLAFGGAGIAWEAALIGAGVLAAMSLALGILGEALQSIANPIKTLTDLGGLSIGEFMKDMAGGILYLTLAFGMAGIAWEAALIGAGVLAVMSLALGILGRALQSIANPIKTFSDSFAKLTENLNIDNLSKIKDGAVAVKEAMSEIRGELNKFSKDDLNVLDKLGNLKASITTNKFSEDDLNVLNKLGNLKASITTGIKGENITNKESANVVMSENIKSAIIEGMRQVKITINLDGRSVGMGVASSIAINEPSSVYDIVTRQAR
jgi:hypothetical protein